MNVQTTRNALRYFLSPLLVIGLSFGFHHNTRAHEGHAGPPTTFMKTKAALKKMLPNDAKIVKRKQPLKKPDIEWAQKTYGVELDKKIYSYYLATDKASGTVLGAAYVTEVPYRHGDLKIAVGIDADKKITQAAILGINEKYVVDFEGNVGTGLIADYAGLPLTDLVAKAKEAASSDKATREFAAAVRDAAVLLAAFTR